MTADFVCLVNFLKQKSKYFFCPCLTLRKRKQTFGDEKINTKIRVKFKYICDGNDISEAFI